jgi:hypothetical protein
MKNTILRNSIVILAVILLPALCGAAQAGAVEYKSTYRATQNTNYRIQSVAPAAATAPAAAFQSTSAYSEQWSGESSSTLLNSDGSVNSGAYMGGGPRRAKMDGPSDGIDPPDEDDDDNIENGTPLGDALIPLALLACAYAIYKISRRRKEA